MKKAIGKLKSNFVALVVLAFVVGLVGGAARAQLLPGKTLDKTKTVAGGLPLGDHYPQDHSQPGSGLSNSLDGSTAGFGCGYTGRQARCYHCPSYFNGSCEWACAGGLWCNDGHSGIFGGKTCIATGSCVTPD